MSKITQLLTLSIMAALLVFLAFLLHSTQRTYADGNIIVDTDVPDIEMDGQCSLIEAIVNANDDAPTHPDCSAGNDSDVIILQAKTTYTLTTINNTVNGANGLPVISSTIVISGNGAIIARNVISGTDEFRIIHVASGHNLTLNNVTIYNGKSYGGGGILNNGILILNNSIIASNQTCDNSYTGGFLTGYDYYGYDGGGIFNTGSLTLNNSTVSNNQTGNAGGYPVPGMIYLCGINGYGGNGGGISSTGALTLTNSTVSGNQTGIGIGFGGFEVYCDDGVGVGGDGGGIYNTGALTLHNSTISNNQTGSGSSASGSGGGICNIGTSNLINTILARNTANDSGTPDCAGELTSSGHNLIQDTTGCIISGDTEGNISGQDPHLGPLSDNGGDTQTHALSPNSPAIDAADNTRCPVTDQRGFPRPVDGNDDGAATCDIGAYELQIPNLTVTKRANSDSVQAEEWLTYTIRVTNTGSVGLHATITDTLPFAVVLDETSGGTLVFPNGTIGITWTAFITTPGGVWVETVVVTVAKNHEGPLTNLVEVATEEGAIGEARVIVNPYKIHLPLVLRSHTAF